MVEAAHPRLSITAQCRLLRISRSSYYYAPVPETDETLALMTVIDATFMDCPWYGSRQMARHLRRAGHEVGRRRVRRLMAKMGLAPIYQRPRTSDPHPQHRVYPYLLSKLAIERPNHVWCADVTYIPMRRGFLYLVAIMDWATRKVLAWRLSNTMDAGWSCNLDARGANRIAPYRSEDEREGSWCRSQRRLSHCSARASPLQAIIRPLRISDLYLLAPGRCDPGASYRRYADELLFALTFCINNHYRSIFSRCEWRRPRSPVLAATCPFHRSGVLAALEGHAGNQFLGHPHGQARQQI